MPTDYYEIPIGEAQVVKEGIDVTLLAWGSHVKLCENVAEDLEKNISIEVIDLKTIAPWDIQCVRKSVEKTGRLVIVHEAPLTGGFAGEIAATIQEICFNSLSSPIKRVCGFDTPFPQIFEKQYLPSLQSVRNTILSLF